jgi:hypothetical protein
MGKDIQKFELKILLLLLRSPNNAIQGGEWEEE